MADEVKLATEAAAEAPAKVLETVAEVAETLVQETAKTARRERAATARRVKAVTNTNFFNGFEAVPAFASFQSLFADAGERGQELVKKSQKVAEELADLTRANVEAVVEASRVAAEGARAIGQD